MKGRVIAERYELVAILGSGTLSTVFRARDFLSGDEIALKVFRAVALRNPAALRAFQRDLAIARDNGHPNIVRILDFGEDGSAFYVAMELVGGTPICMQAAGGPDWPEDAAWSALEQLAAALGWLHSRGVVHGDVRGSNVVWNQGTIKLMDFGPQRDSRQVTLDAPDWQCPYASPERLMGRPLNPASDLYSAAAVICELLTGEPPGARGGLLEKAIVEAPSLGDRVPGISEELASILERCLNPDPVLRPAAAAEIADYCRAARSRGGVHVSTRRAGAPVMAERFGNTPGDVTEVCQLLLAICRVLAGIHDAGLAHPDVSPRNIAFSAGGAPQMESFPAPPPNATLAITEPKYVAPEMLLSKATTEDAAHLRGDVYVLGFMAYEALAGRDALRRQLFQQESEPETDLFWMKWHADRSARLQPLCEINPSVNQELSTLIQGMTEKDPLERISSLAEVERALLQLQQRLITTEDIELGSFSVSTLAARAGRAKRRKVSSRAWIVIGVLACVIMCTSLPLMRGVSSKPALANARRRVAQTMAWGHGRVTELLHRPSSTSASPKLPAAVETASGPMVLVPGGRSVIGSSAVPNESPAHTVYLAAFYIDKYEVSNGSYRAFTDRTGYPQPPAPSWDADYFAKSTHPVVNVSWRDAQAFCIAAGKRLPAEAEWEKAARGASPTSRFWANWTVKGLANLKDAGQSLPAPVGSFPADVSPFGAYDMAGNVHEWVNDEYVLYSGNPASLDRAGESKVVRGGSFAVALPELSPSWRASLNPSVIPGSDSPVGFRCAADPSAVTMEGARQITDYPRAQSRP